MCIFVFWRQPGGPSLTCHPRGNGIHLTAHPTPSQCQPVLQPQGSDPAEEKKKRTYRSISGPESEGTVQGWEPLGLDCHTSLNCSQALLTIPCSPAIRSSSIAWPSFFILPFFFTSARLGMERGTAPFLMFRFCESERRVRVQGMTNLLPLPLMRAGLGPHRSDTGVLRGRLGVLPTSSLPGCGRILAG